MDPFLPDDQKIAAIRELLPATGAGIYLDTVIAGPVPAETDRALREADDWELRVGRVAPDRSDETAQRADEARSVVAATLGVSPGGVVLAAGPHAAVGALFSAWPPAAGDRLAIVGTLLPELDAAVRSTATSHGCRVVSLGPADEMPRSGLVVIPTADAATGALMPVDEVSRHAHQAGCRVAVDASLSAAAIPLAHGDLGSDALLLDGHRWLLGPEGITTLWLGPGLDVEAATKAVDMPPRRTLLGLARSGSWLLMYVGLPWAQERTRHLAARLAARLATIDGVELAAPPTEIGALVVFRIRGWSADEAADELGQRVFAIVGRDPDRGWVRASVGAWNREDELDRFAETCAVLAGHSPATVPRRPSPVVMARDR